MGQHEYSITLSPVRSKEDMKKLAEEWLKNK
jgi:hypothetical protein